MVMDSEPFRELYHILQDLNDERIWVFAEWVRFGLRFVLQSVWPFRMFNSSRYTNIRIADWQVVHAQAAGHVDGRIPRKAVQPHRRGHSRCEPSCRPVHSCSGLLCPARSPVSLKKDSLMPNFVFLRTACPANTEWVVVTNGDNDYASSFFSRLAAAKGGADLIAFDFYSRYHRATGI